MAVTGAGITVLGGGIAGLAVARALALRGARVTVLEQSDAIREVGAGLQISPNGARVMAALGLGPALATAAMRARAVHLIRGDTGAGVMRLDLAAARPGWDYHLIHRADLIALLLEGALSAGVELQLLQKVEAVDLSGARPRLRMATGAAREADLLIGADGLHSRLRAALNGDVAPLFTNRIAWRATIPALPGEGGDPVAEVHMGPGRHLVSYPLRGGTLRNIIAVEERRRWAAEGWSLRDEPGELRQAFAGFAPRVQGWLDRVAEVGLWGLFRHPVAQSWHQGRAALLGDAAHPTLPFLAQGANLALEDAWVLAEALDRHDRPEDAFAAYQAARRLRTSAVVAAADRSGRIYHLGSPLREAAHLAMRLGSRIAPSLPLRRFDWIHGHDVTAGD
ncbi:FAD-dependent monooxygenase [Szabonella alba]|uniref:FAD-dependent monooxygenase n=1 Tax=Szabonella alba TaxID=2804194 RepID=A0A8K0Y117_9RHOB|nr:FAD-dependent monooxygenase [Szabonella alba]MBL4917417.1 FAD-dependent monooxygenase [Szabonella alba]